MFHTPVEVMYKVNPAHTYSVVSYLSSYYHQIRIIESDAHLFEILLEDGIYIYVCQPMGFSNGED